MSRSKNGNWSRIVTDYSDRKPLVLKSYLDAQDFLPYADDSDAVSPMSEDNNAMIIPSHNITSRHSSYTSHSSRISCTSHADAYGRGLPITRERQLLNRRNFNEPDLLESDKYHRIMTIKRPLDNNPFLDQQNASSTINPNIDIKDVMVLSDIIDQAAGRRRKSNEIAESEEDMEIEVPTFKQKLKSFLIKSVDFFCVWDCCWFWVKLQEIFKLIVYDPFMELFITLCIVVNTLFMALDHYNMDADFERILVNGNLFFSTTFAIEAFMKLLAVSPKYYFKEGWNVFDFIIVALSLIEIFLEGVRGLSVLRSFRLLRVFKLAKSWPTLNLLITIMGKTLGDLGNLTFVLAILVFIFAVMGMQLFGSTYEKKVDMFPDGVLPRWNFKDFMHSFMIVFRVLCGEWIESMWNCMHVCGFVCVPFFLATVVIGHLVMLNLFLALLLSSFGASNLSSPATESADTKKLQEAFDRFARAHHWIKNRLLDLLKVIRSKTRNQIADQTLDMTIENDDNNSTLHHIYHHHHHHHPLHHHHHHLHNQSNDLSCDGQVTLRDIKNDYELVDSIEYALQSNKVNFKSNALLNSVKYNNTVLCDLKSDNNLIICDKNAHYMDNNRLKLTNDGNDTGDDVDGDDGKYYTHDTHSDADRSNKQLIKLLPSNNITTTTTTGSNNSSSLLITNQSTVITSDHPINTKEVNFEKNDNYYYPQTDAAGEDGDVIGDDDEDANKMIAITGDVSDLDHPQDCLPENWYKKFPCCLQDNCFWINWRKLRSTCYKLVEDKYFETVVITLILVSSLTLALEDVNLKERKWLEHFLKFTDQFFTIIFAMEMVLKWVAYGFRCYFSNAWCWLDFVIVMFALINTAGNQLGFSNVPIFKTMRTLRALRPLRALSKSEGMRVSLANAAAEMAGLAKIQAFKTMRTLRALRPLRAMSKMQGMRVVVNALVQAIPAIFNVLLVCLIFWLIFAIMGVQLFAGKFSYCRDKITEIHSDPYLIPNKSACLQNNDTLEWFTPMVNFDNVLNGYLSLFQVATFKGWTVIMDHAIDSRELNQQPIKENNIYMYLYFVFFIIFGAFFTLNLFIGVIIDNFNEQKKKGTGSREMLMTEDQKKYLNAMKKMGSRKPMKAIPRPRFKLQAIMFDVVTNKKFDMIIMMFIMLNMVVMALDHYNATVFTENILESCNLFFIAIFTAECLLKLFALRYHYFREPWNVFDFIIVILSIAGSALKDFVENYFFSPTLLRVVRVVKIGRILRLVKGARGIRTLLFALAMSLPALFNICLLLFLVIFIYAIFGMSFFMNVKQRHGLDDTFNFGTFFKSFILLFQMCTSAGWSEVLDAIMDESKCDNDGELSDCGSKKIAVAYLVTYLIISFLVIINMYIAVILENYSQATEDVQEGLTDDDYDMYYEIWQQFDPNGTQFIPYTSLSDFLDALEEPLRIPKPNKYKIVQMDIPICVNNQCYCVEILDILTREFFARKGKHIEETLELEEVLPLKGRFEHISSTFWRQREEYCAKLIQSTWRQYKQKKAMQLVQSNAPSEMQKNRNKSVTSSNGSLRSRKSVKQINMDAELSAKGHKVVVHKRSSISSGK